MKFFKVITIFTLAVIGSGNAYANNTQFPVNCTVKGKAAKILSKLTAQSEGQLECVGGPDEDICDVFAPNSSNGTLIGSEASETIVTSVVRGANISSVGGYSFLVHFKCDSSAKVRTCSVDGQFEQ